MQVIDVSKIPVNTPAFEALCKAHQRIQSMEIELAEARADAERERRAKENLRERYERLRAEMLDGEQLEWVADRAMVDALSGPLYVHSHEVINDIAKELEAQ